MMFTLSTGEAFATLAQANAYALEHAVPNSGIAVTLPQGGRMSLWDFRVWSTVTLRRIEAARARVATEGGSQRTDT